VNYGKLLLSGLTAFAIAGGGALLAVIADLPADEVISVKVWIITGVTGIMAASKDIRTYLADSPV